MTCSLSLILQCLHNEPFFREFILFSSQNNSLYKWIIMSSPSLNDLISYACSWPPYSLQLMFPTASSLQYDYSLYINHVVSNVNRMQTISIWDLPLDQFGILLKETLFALKHYHCLGFSWVKLQRFFSSIQVVPSICSAVYV